jgi:putative ABC transport system ATP-binding protein
MIQLENITRIYGKDQAATKALFDLNLKIEKGAFVTVVGSSGSGKTTLLNIIGGLDSGYSGRAVVDGQDLSCIGDALLSRYRNQMVGFVFQHFNLLEHLSALQNVSLPSFFSSANSRQADERSRRMLERVGLGEKIHSLPSQLSGGQKQRVAIARALFFEPGLILCDEPTGNLDTKTGSEIIALFESLNQEDGLTVLTVTHEEFLFKKTTQCVHLEDGCLVED